jgi:hypothetical protein
MARSRLRRIWNWLLTGRSIRQLRAYSIAGCPETSGQGVVEAWISERGRPILICDVCHAASFVPDATAGCPTATRSRPTSRGRRPGNRWRLVSPFSRAWGGER